MAWTMGLVAAVVGEGPTGEAMQRLAESQVQMGLVGSSIWVMSPKNKKTQ